MPVLLLLHSLVSMVLVVAGRTGFERTVGQPVGRFVVVFAAVGALLGGSMHLLRGSARLERSIAGLALCLPLLWLWVSVMKTDYDAIAALMSASSWGEQGGAWFPGLPAGALCYTFVVSLYTHVCWLALKGAVGLRYESVVGPALWALWAVSLAGVVHLATGW